jgi:hypothetical protein
MAGTILDDVIRMSRSQRDGSLTLPNVKLLMRTAQTRGMLPAGPMSTIGGDRGSATEPASPMERPPKRPASVGEAIRDTARTSLTATHANRIAIGDAARDGERAALPSRVPPFGDLKHVERMGKPAASVVDERVEQSDRDEPLARQRSFALPSFRRDPARAPLPDQREHAVAERREIEQIIEILHAQQSANRQLLRSAADAIGQMIDEIRAAHSEFDRIRDSLRNR